MRGSGERQALLGRGERPQHLVVDGDEVERLGRGLLIAGDHRRHRIADEADQVAAQRMLVLADRQDAVGDREVVAGQHQVDAVEGPGPRDVDRPDPARAAPSIAAAGSAPCAGGSRSSANRVWPVTLARPSTRRRALPTTPPWLFGMLMRSPRAAPAWSPAREAGQLLPRPRRSGGSRCSGTGCPDSASQIRSRDGCGSRSSSARAVIRMPGVQ